MVVGASAGIMGVAGAVLVGRLIGRGRVRETLQPVSAGMLGGCLVVLLALGAFVDFIAQAGHIGGLLAGALLGAAWSGREAIVGLAGRLGLAGTVAGLVLVARQPESREHYDEFLGHAYLKRGQPAGAMIAFGRALETRPEDAGLKNSVAYSLALEGVELGRARALVEEALAVEPENPDYLDTLGWIECRSGEFDAGRGLIQQALDHLNQGDPEIEMHLETCETVQVSSDS